MSIHFNQNYTKSQEQKSTLWPNRVLYGNLHIKNRLAVLDNKAKATIQQPKVYTMTLIRPLTCGGPD